MSLTGARLRAAEEIELDALLREYLPILILLGLAVGLGLIGLYNAALRIPYVVIGGVDETNIDMVVDSGAKTVAVVRAIFDAKDPKAAAQFFKQKISRNRTKENSHA